MFFKKLVTVPYQVVMFIVLTGALFFMIQRPMHTFMPIFEEPEIAAGSDLAQKTVRVGLTMDDFTVFDLKKNIFVVKGVLWFEYNPQEVSYKQIDDFYLERGEILKKHGPVLELPGGLQRAVYYITVKYSTVLDYSMFPFDDHRIFLEIIYPSLDPSLVRVLSEPSDFLLGKNLHSGGWTIMTHRTKSGIRGTQMPSGKEEKVLKSFFSVGVTKRDFRLIMILLFPLLLIFYFGVFSFSLSGERSLSLSLTSVSGLIAYRYVISSLEPAVSYFIISDYFYLVILIESFVIFSVNLFCASDHTYLSTENLTSFRGMVLVLLYIMLLVMWYYITYVLYGSTYGGLNLYAHY
jgi:hypothetical protein